MWKPLEVSIHAHCKTANPLPTPPTIYHKVIMAPNMMLLRVLAFLILSSFSFALRGSSRRRQEEISGPPSKNRAFQEGRHYRSSCLRYNHFSWQGTLKVHKRSTSGTERSMVEAHAANMNPAT
ncbi:autophagy protein 5-like [Dorcoceras hygrometricum]|uniref:Autophagy protein 5-like n=1 Tax=Dorcoceras hygrometricum TaxID=472368 RepID=A0A2Z7DEE1_9LAMI|nr:autophagy protein 5-like [Dorcoceras hygrometricum]